ncbi:MAG: hypothetical protein Q7K43_01360 [Candidatus Woesearchaeota archaeon]|nr:hypothetical protein [Candidatus Woesearchaeota archaeon]
MQQQDLTSILKQFNTLDKEYGTNWQKDTFLTDVSVSKLSELSDVLQNLTLELNASNKTMLSLLVASRGSMVESQIEFAKAHAYGPEGVVKIPKSGMKIGEEYAVSCGQKTKYSRVAELFENALENAKRSAQAFGYAQKLATPSEQLRISIPEFYKTNYAQITSAIESNRAVVKNCENYINSYFFARYVYKMKH